ncbi:MAG: LysE family translocator [Pseudomonadota bacterium]
MDGTFVDGTFVDSLASLLAFFAAGLLFAVSMTVTPGPNNLMLLLSSIRFGPRRTVPHALGIIIGVPFMLLSIGFGLGQIFLLYPALHLMIKIIGAAYLLYLAWKMAFAPIQSSNSRAPSPMTFMQSALFQWVNPKAWVMVIGAVGTFTSLGDAIFIEIAVLAIAFMLAAVVSTSVWICFGEVLGRLLNNPQQRRWFNGLMGLLLVATVLPMLSSSL